MLKKRYLHYLEYLQLKDEEIVIERHVRHKFYKKHIIICAWILEVGQIIWSVHFYFETDR